MFYILAGLFCLFFTATSYCNVVWPVVLLGSLFTRYMPAETPDAYVYTLFALLILMLIPLEAYLYHWFLKGISYIRALYYTGIANTTTLLAIFIGAIFAQIGIFNPLLNPFVTYNIINNIGDAIVACLICIFIFTALAELLVMRLVTGYSSKKLIIPVLSGYALTIAILILAQLLFALQK